MSLDAGARGLVPIRLRRALNITLVIALLMLGVALINTAEAAHVQCGQIITQSITLDSDVGPCPADGLIIRANNITVDLGGHRVFAAVPNGAPENVGIRLGRVSGVTVRNGTVEGFDAGVAIIGGGGNTITRITAQNNINDMQEPFPWVPNPPPGQPHRPTPEEMPLMECLFGDGITTLNSDDNRIERNRVIGNGPFGGITLVEDSDNNRVLRNVVEDSNISNRTTNVSGQPVNSLCGGTVFPPGMTRGRTVQGIGIRIEGPGANNNLVEDNFVDNSGLVGISIHSYVQNPEPRDPRGPQNPNTNNLITRNEVQRTGAETFQDDPFADGIASLAQGPIGRVTRASPDNTIVRNNSHDNLRHGISLGNTVERTTVNDNIVNNNRMDGIRLELGAVNNILHGNRGPWPPSAQQLANGEHDGHDANPNCDNNDWLRNRFRVVNQPCVAEGGTGWLGGPGNSENAPGQQDQGPNSARRR